MSRPDASHPSIIHQIHRWAIDHSNAVIAAYLAFFLFSVFAAIYIIPRRFAPYIKSPLLAVVTPAMGWNAKDVELKITNPVEETLQSVPGFRYIRSTSQDGLSTVTLEFPYGTDMSQKERTVQSMLSVIARRLPQNDPDIKTPYVTLADPLNLPVLSVAISPKPGSGVTLDELRTLCDNELRNRLKDIPDVSSVYVFGGHRRQAEVSVDLRKLATLGLTVEDIKNAIESNSIVGSGGSLIDGPSEVIIGADSRSLTAQQIAAIPVKSAGNPPFTVTIGDVAQVKMGAWQKRSAYAALIHEPGKKADIIPAIEVSITQNPGASSAEVVPKIEAELQQLQLGNPGFEYKVAYDNSHFVNILYRNVWEELGSAVILTGIAILLFLGDSKAAVISIFTLPTSLSIAILAMIPFHFSFNSGTLIGLLLSIGRLADDTIIDVHNVQRWIGLGHSRREATIQGIAEVRTAVIGSTIMIVIALVPLTLAGGLVGQMFYQLVWPLIFGLLASMLVSFTLTPILTCHFLTEGEAYGKPIRGLGWLQNGLARMEGGYRKWVHWCLGHRFVILVLAASTIVIGGTFYNFIGSEMMPLADTGSASAKLEMSPGSSFADLQRGVKQIEGIIARHPEVEKVSIEMGEEPMEESWNANVTGYQMAQSNGATMMLTLSDKEDRTKSIWDVIDSIQSEAMRTVPGLRLFQIKEMGSDVMASPDSPVTIAAYGPSLRQLDSIGEGMMKVANNMPDELYQPGRSWALGRPEAQAVIDPVRASQFGVSPQAVMDQLQASAGGLVISRGILNSDRRPDSIVIRASAGQRQTLDDLKRMTILNDKGQQVPLNALAEIELDQTPTLIEHDGLRRVLKLSAYYRKDHAPSMDAIMDWMRNSYAGIPTRNVAPVNFPPGYGILVRGDMTQMMESVARLLNSFIISLILMYFVLAIQFKGFLNPLKMAASLPLELSGVFIALWAAHAAFSTVSILGIIVLTGMDITAAVLMIDLLAATAAADKEAHRRSGVPLDPGEIRSHTADACVVRLRPILMTTILTLVVMIPVAAFPKTGLDAYQPLAVAIVGGLSVGTVLSLFVIPVLHSTVDDAADGLSAFWKRLTSSRKRQPDDNNP